MIFGCEQSVRAGALPQGTSIPVYWPGGGVLPGVTTTASRSDIFAYRTFDGENIATAGLYAVVVGQNFAN